MIAYDFPLLSMFWVVLMWCAMLAIFFAVIWAFIDNFARHDHHGWAKAGWAFLILVLPLVGTLVYLVARPADTTAARPAEAVHAESVIGRVPVTHDAPTEVGWEQSMIGIEPNSGEIDPPPMC